MSHSNSSLQRMLWNAQYSGNMNICINDDDDVRLLLIKQNVSGADALKIQDKLCDSPLTQESIASRNM